MSAAHNDPAPRRRGKARVPAEPPPPPARIDDDPRLDGWRWRTQRIRGDQFGALVDHHCLIAPDGWSTKLYQRPTKAIAEALRRVRSLPKEKPVPTPTETIPELPEIPPDLLGWEWELSDAGDARLTHPAEGYATSWGPAGPDADYGGRLGEARKRVAADAAVAAEERALIVAGDEPGGLPQLSTTMQRHVDRALAADRKGGEALWEKATAVADARVDAQRYGEWGLFLEATGLQERAAQRLVAIATRGRADGRFRDAVISGWLSFSVAHLTAQADDALIEQLLAAPVTPTKRQVEQILAPNNPSPGTGSARPVPTPPPATLDVLPSLRRLLAQLDAHNAQPLLYGVPASERRAWEADYQTVCAIGHALHRMSGLDAAANALHQGAVDQLIGQINDGMLKASLEGSFGTREPIIHTAAEIPPPDPFAAVRSAILAGPHRWGEAVQRIAEMTPLAEQELWLDDLALARRADAAMRERDAAGAWEALNGLADRELRERLLEAYAGAARELAVAWPPEPTPSPSPALPPGWSWRPRGDSAVQAWDGTIARMTTCYRPGQEGEAAAHAWRIAGATPAAEPPAEESIPLTPPEYGEWEERARAVGATLSRDAATWQYVLTLPDGSVEPRDAWLATVSRIRGLEVDSPPPAEAEEPDAIPADARPTYAQAEQRLARLLAAADPELKRFLRVVFAVAALSDDPLSDDDLWDELTGNLIAAGDELLAYAMGEAVPPAPPQPAGDPEFDRWPHVDHPALDDLSTELMSAELALDPPDGGAVAHWQDTLDAHMAELDDQTYERLAHRIGELRKRAKETT